MSEHGAQGHGGGHRGLMVLGGFLAFFAVVVVVLIGSSVAILVTK